MNKLGRPQKYPDGFACPGCNSIQAYYCSNLCKKCYRRELDARRYQNPEIKASRIAAASQWNKANPAARKEHKARAYRNNPVPVKEKAARWYWQGTNKIRHRARKYGMSQEDFFVLLTAQNNACAICKEIPSGHGRDILAIDHDHATGKVRQLLCQSCNVVLGHIEKKGSVIFDAMKEYLASH